MRTLILVLFLSLFGLSVKVQAQFTCGTRPLETLPNNPPLAVRVSGPTASWSVHPLHPLCKKATIQLAFHLVRNSKGQQGFSQLASDGVTPVQNSLLNILNTEFNQHGINFILKPSAPSLDIIDSDNYYNTSSSDANSNYGSSANNGKFHNFSPNAHEDAIDIYLLGNGLGNFHFAADIGATAIIYVGKPGEAADTSITARTIIHEMGHCLGLHHTFFGTACNTTISGSFIENRPPGSWCEMGGIDSTGKYIGNGKEAGDYVWDTWADPTDIYGYHNSYADSACRFQPALYHNFFCFTKPDILPQATTHDPAGFKWSPLLNNFMDYGYAPICTLKFTTGQVERMKQAIANDYNIRKTVVKGTTTLNIQAVGNLQQCSDNPSAVTLTAISSDTASYYYKWQAGQTIISQDTGTITVLPGKTTTYTLTAYSECMHPATVQETVAIDEDVHFTITGNPAVCAGSSQPYSISYTDSSNTLTNGIWSTTAGDGSIDNNGVLTVNGYATGTITLAYTGITPSWGCSPVVTKTITIVPPNATVQVTAVSNDLDSIPTTEICSTQSLLLMASGTAGLSYVWNTSPAQYSSAIVIAPTTSKQYILTGISPCNTQVYDTINITVHSLPIVSLHADTSIMCVGETIEIQYTPASNTGVTHSWNMYNQSYDGYSNTIFSLGSIDYTNPNSPHPALFTATAHGKLVLEYSYTDSNYCTNTAADTITIYAQGITLSTGNSEICEGTQTTVYANIPNGVWASSNENIAVVNAATGVVTGVGAGTANISYTVTACGNTLFVKDTAIVVLPTLAITQSVNVLYGYPLPTSYQFTANMPGGTWTSSNTNVATIGSTGLVTTQGTGFTTIEYNPPSGVVESACSGTLSVLLEVIADAIPCNPSIPALPTTIDSIAVYADNVFEINDTVTVTGILTIRNAQVKATNPYAAIVLQNGASLRILGSRLYGDNMMWQGIRIAGVNNATLTINEYNGKASYIEDADTAVVYRPQSSEQYVNIDILHIANSIFNRNKVSISITGLGSVYNNHAVVLPVKIYNNIFTSREIIFHPCMMAWNSVETLKTTPLTAATPFAGTPLSYESPYIADNNYPSAFLKDSLGTNKPRTAIAIQYTGSMQNGAYQSLAIGAVPTYNNYYTAARLNTNIFDNHNIGIYAENSNIVVNNCTFQNGTGWHGYGILSMGSCVPVPNNQLDCTNNNVINISTIPGSPNNAFFNMKTAIEIAGGKQITIKDCDIRSSQSNTDIDSNLYLIGSYGIRVGNHYFENINISNNKLYNIRNAINVFCARDRIPNNVINPIDVGRISVDNNIIKKELPGGNAVQGYSGTEYIENAIHIASLYLHHENAEPVLCKNNTIQEAINGIKLSYWQNKHTQVDSNTITLAEHPTNTNPNLETYGICLEAGFGINETGLGNTVTDNTITGAGMNANSNGTGILLMQQGNTNIGCNTVRNNKHGFRFFGNNPNTQFWDNTMDADNQYGFTLDNGIIGMQGNLPTVTGGGYICPSNNSWQYAMDNTYWNAANDQYMTNCINSLPSQSPLVVLDINGQEHLNPDGSGTSDPYISGYFYQHTGDPLTELIWYAPYSDTECDHCTNATYYGRNSEDFTILEQIADGTILLLNDRPEDRLLVMQEQLFELLYAQPDLLANSNSLQQFIYNNQWTSLDFIYYAGQMLREGNMEMVQILLDYWPNENSNLSEAYYAYFEWLLNMYSDPNYQPDLNEVWELANQCPLTHGTIVYAVRNLYNTLTEKINDFENNCEPPAARGGNKPAFIRLKEPKKKIEVQEKEKTKLVLYPNPTNGIVNISFPDIKQVSVIDITGRTVLGKQTGGVNNMQLNVGSIGKGIFLVRVTDTKGNAHTSKLVIQ